MSTTETEKKRFAAQYLVEVANGFNEQLAQNEKMIEDRKIALAAVTTFSSDILNFMDKIHENLEDQNQDAESKIQNVNEVVKSLIQSLKDLPRAQREEIISLEATQNGMKRSIETMVNFANAQLEELDAQKTEKKQKIELQDDDWDDT